METAFYGCGCFVSSSMFGEEIIAVGVCFKHSLVESIHEAQKALAEVTGGVEHPENWQDEEVQAALAALAEAVRAAQDE